MDTWGPGSFVLYREVILSLEVKNVLESLKVNPRRACTARITALGS